MAIVHLLLAMVAVLAGFIGLVILIKGFVDKSNKFIKLGTLLFSVMLIIGVLAGAGTSINAQRYRDSVTSLQSTLQQQYSDSTTSF